MTKVLFLAAPFKSRFIEHMAEFFSSEICWKMVISDYSPSRHRTKSLNENIVDRVLGTRKLAQAAKEFKPDVIYTDNLSYSGQVEIISCFTSIGVPHTFFIFEGTGGPNILRGITLPHGIRSYVAYHSTSTTGSP